MDEKKLKALAAELAKGLKTEANLNAFSRIYTTNAIGSLNSAIRVAIKKRKVFPTDDSVRKVIYLASKDASKKWSMPVKWGRPSYYHPACGSAPGG